MAQKRSDDVSATSQAYDAMLPRWHLIGTLLGGTAAMRAAGKAYLPKYEQERDQTYKGRLARAVLVNTTEQTLEHLVGRALRNDPVPGDDVPQAVLPILEDVDRCGSGLAKFARDWFRSALAKAFCHVLVDMPATRVPADGRPRTLADDRDEGVRPYWVLVEPEDLIFASGTTVDGRFHLEHVRIREDEVVRSGFVEERVERIRVIECAFPGTAQASVSWQLWENSRRQKGQKDEWRVVDEGQMGIGSIPLVTLYTSQSGLMLGKPPLEDLAHLNVAHWQSSSDQRNILTVTRFPMLAVSGGLPENNADITVGPNQWLHMPDPNGRFYYIEHNGAAIEAGTKDLESLEAQMAGYGAEFLKKRPGAELATVRALDSAESASALQAMAKNLKDSLEQALRLTAQWLNLGDDAGGSIVMELEEGLTLDEEAPALDALEKARARRDISRRTYLEGLRSRGVLPEDFDPDDDQELLDQEVEELPTLRKEDDRGAQG